MDLTVLLMSPSVGNYVDGVSITYGAPPTHIWTYAVGNDQLIELNCPCNTQPGTAPPSYVGSDYYCETGDPTAQGWRTADPLWDGLNCGLEEPCCNHNGWFMKNVTSPTTELITVRVCTDTSSPEDIGLERFELYVK